jgi:hypothetical protein
MATKNPRARVIRTSESSKSSLYIEDNSISMIGNSKNFIVCDERGITLKGAISIIADSFNIRTGGLFVGLNDFVEMIPSTIVTPIPKKVPFPPIFAVKEIVKDVAFFTAQLV